MNVYQQQEQEARVYNKAFLHGRSVGLDDGKKIVIDRVLEIIEDVFMEVSNGLIHTPSEALEETNNRVLALKGEQE